MNQLEKEQLKMIRQEAGHMTEMQRIDLETARLRHETAKVENEAQRVILAYAKRLATTDEMPKLPTTTKN